MVTKLCFLYTSHFLSIQMLLKNVLMTFYNMLQSNKTCRLAKRSAARGIQLTSDEVNQLTRNKFLNCYSRHDDRTSNEQLPEIENFSRKPVQRTGRMWLHLLKMHFLRWWRYDDVKREQKYVLCWLNRILSKLTVTSRPRLLCLTKAVSQIK